MPEGVYEVHPFLAAVRPNRTVKVPDRAGVALLQQSDQIVVQRGLGFGGQLELPVKGLEVVTNRIHGSIVRQDLPFVNGKLSDLQGIRFVSLHLPDADSLLITLDGQGIYRGDEKACPVHTHGK